MHAEKYAHSWCFHILLWWVPRYLPIFLNLSFQFRWMLKKRYTFMFPLEIKQAMGWLFHGFHYGENYFQRKRRHQTLKPCMAARSMSSHVWGVICEFSLWSIFCLHSWKDVYIRLHYNGTRLYRVAIPIAGTLGCVFIDNGTHESGVTKFACRAFSWHHSSVFHCQWTHNQVFLLLSHMLI